MQPSEKHRLLNYVVKMFFLDGQGKQGGQVAVRLVMRGRPSVAQNGFAALQDGNREIVWGFAIVMVFDEKTFINRIKHGICRSW